MAQFGVYRNPNARTRKLYPYLLDVQADFLRTLRTAMVVPLMPLALLQGPPMARLCPIVDIAGEPHVALVPQMSGMERLHLGDFVQDAVQYRSQFIAAIDFLITGS
jgi:toxin CcdB